MTIELNTPRAFGRTAVVGIAPLAIPWCGCRERRCRQSETCCSSSCRQHEFVVDSLSYVGKLLFTAKKSVYMQLQRHFRSVSRKYLTTHLIALNPGPYPRRFCYTRRPQTRSILSKHEVQPCLVHGDLWGGNQGFVAPENDPVWHLRCCYSSGSLTIACLSLRAYGRGGYRLQVYFRRNCFLCKTIRRPSPKQCRCDSNAHQVIFDPATYYGDREVDLGMTHVFGGFPPAFYRG